MHVKSTKGLFGAKKQSYNNIQLSTEDNTTSKVAINQFKCYGAYMAVCCKTPFLCYFLCSLRHLPRGVGWCTFFVSYGYPLHKSYHKVLGCPRETSFHLHLKAITKPTRKEQKDGNKSLTVTSVKETSMKKERKNKARVARKKQETGRQIWTKIRKEENENLIQRRPH